MPLTSQALAAHHPSPRYLMREDPDDHLVALVSRHLPSLLDHRGLVAAGLIVLGLGKLVAAAAMWQGHKWGGGYLLAATVALLLPFALHQAVNSPTAGHVLLATANTAAWPSCSSFSSCGAGSPRANQALNQPQ
jgi:Predicted membrane protein (DUF2127)